MFLIPPCHEYRRHEINRILITDEESVDRAAAQCPDVTLLINNAGVGFDRGLIAAPDLSGARMEMDVNYFGTLMMCRAFAPVLKHNGGGAIINMVSMLARVNLPFNGSYCASKAATLSLTQGVRAELAAQGTLVIAVIPGTIDIGMGKFSPPPRRCRRKKSLTMLYKLRSIALRKSTLAIDCLVNYTVSGLQ